MSPTDPVTTADGHAYEREAIARWFEGQRRNGDAFTAPLTNEVRARARARRSLPALSPRISRPLTRAHRTSWRLLRRSCPATSLTRSSRTVRCDALRANCAAVMDPPRPGGRCQIPATANV